MMKRAMALCLLLGSAAAAQAGDVPRFDVAITVDDLPAHGQLPPGTTRADIARRFLATLKAHHVTEAYGFVNARGLAEDPASDAVLTLWRKAGYPLANHSYSHLNLDGAPSLDAWQADVIAGEPALERHMGKGDWHWLRFPNLSSGKDAARHDGAAAFLKQRGYRIASVSLAFEDWDYSDAYARCRAQGDDRMIAAMKRHYLAVVDQAIARAKANAQRVHGRPIPHVLLLHVGAWTADTLPDVMARLDAAGGRYIPLAQAEADPAYAQAEALPGGGGIIERVAQAQGIALPADSAPASEIDLRQACRAPG